MCVWNRHFYLYANRWRKSSNYYSIKVNQFLNKLHLNCSFAFWNTCATVCSPIGRSSFFNTTRCTIDELSFSRMMLVLYEQRKRERLVMMKIHQNFQQSKFQFTLCHRAHLRRVWSHPDCPSNIAFRRSFLKSDKLHHKSKLARSTRSTRVCVKKGEVIKLVVWCVFAMCNRVIIKWFDQVDLCV